MPFIHTHLPIVNMDMVPKGKTRIISAGIEDGYRKDMKETNMVIPINI